MTAMRQPSAEGWTPGADGGGRENRVLRELVTIYHHLTGLALQSAGLETVAGLLADRTGARVAVVSPRLDVLAAAPDAHDAARDRLSAHRLGRVLKGAAQTRRPLRVPAAGSAPSLVVAPILVGDEIVAYLLTEQEAPSEVGEDLSLLVTEHAATICGVILGRERIVASAAGRVRDDLVEGLLLGRASSPEETQRWARHLGYDAAEPYRVAALAPEDGGSPEAAWDAARLRRIFGSVEHFVAGRDARAIVAVRDRELVIVAPGRGPAVVQLATACLGHARRAFPEVVLTAGAGGQCQEPTEIARSYAQARRTIEIARRLGLQGRAVAFEELGVHRLLLQVPDAGELRAFAGEVLGPLCAHERKHRSEYLKTLAVYFRENGSLQRAARQLHVHANTVTYRLNRVEEITGLVLDRYQDRLMAQVALEILEALGDPG